MNYSKFLVSFSLVLSTAFCASVLADNHLATPDKLGFEIFWSTPEKHPIRAIDRFDFVTLFSDKRPFVVPLKVRISEQIQLNPANAYELAWDGSGVS